MKGIFILGAALAGTALAEERFAFYVSGDSQYVAQHSREPKALDPYSDEASTRFLNILESLPGKRIPDRLGGGRVADAILGVVVTGDLIDSADKNGPRYKAMQKLEWERWQRDYDALPWPVYELHGNHDGPQGKTLVTSGIVRRNCVRKGVVNMSKNRLHYAWDWGPLHLVSLGMFIGEGDARKEGHHYAPRSSLEFLRANLAEQVGESGRPVVLCCHLHPFGPEFDWPKEDLEALAEIVEKYNVVALFHGHTHGSPPSRTRWDGSTFDPNLPDTALDIFNPDDSGAAKTDTRNPEKGVGLRHGFLYVEVIDREGTDNDEFRVRSYATKDNWATHDWDRRWSRRISIPDQPYPFPHYRVRDFYAKQARQQLVGAKPTPAILPQFPGLDGGVFGHWGQNPEADNFDHRLNEVDTGEVLAQVTKHNKRITTKAVNVRVGDHTAMFDPERLTFTGLWKGGMVKWQSRRYGITSGVASAGEPVMDLAKARWKLPQGTTSKYHGFFRGKNRVEFSYEIGARHVRESVFMENGELKHILVVNGDLPEGAILESPLPVERRSPSGRPSHEGSESPPVMPIVPGTGPGPYVIDTLVVPYRDENPFKSPMRLSGIDFLPDGRAAVSNLMGDVWVVSGLTGGLDMDDEWLTWDRFASGLHQPLGLVVDDDGDIVVIGRDQLTRLHDLSGFGAAEFYECLTNAFPTSRGNSFALTLHRDRDGSYYWFTRSGKFGMTKFEDGGQPESIATGLRGTNGTGVSPDGKIVFATAQEGPWTPTSAIFEVGGGSYHGFFGPKKEYGKHGYQMPMCFIPRGIDNSCGDIVFVPDDPRFGPLAGTIIGTSFGYCSHYLVLREEIAGRSQGGVVPLPGEFLSGVHRVRFNPHDGCLYFVGTDGWQSYARRNGCLQRLRYVGGDMHLPTAVETRENGLIVRFNTKVDPASATKENVFCQQWNYLYADTYGSAEYSVAHPDRFGHDPVEVRSVHAIEDGNAVFVEIPQLHPVMQFHIHMDLETEGGDDFTPDIYYSIFDLGEPFTGFEGYEKIDKLPFPDFPKAGEHPRDPRLIDQEELGKSVDPMQTLQVETIAGLQFTPNRLTATAGMRTALLVRNTDESMPHNLVLVKPESLQRVGEGSMKLANAAHGAARHYVIDDDGVLCMSPILAPGEQYTIYFNTPGQPGEYPFICTFPGHWQVTRGILEVVARK